MTADYLLLRETGQPLQLFRRERRGFSPAGQFADDRAGHAACRQWLLARGEPDVLLFCREFHETSHSEACPPLRGGDLQALIARRLEQQFGARAWTSWSAGRTTDNGEKTLLLTGLRPDPNLATLADLPHASLTTPGLLLPALLRVHGMPTERLLAVVGDERELHQYLIVAGRTQHSRHTPLPALTGHLLASHVTRENDALRQHLGPAFAGPGDLTIVLLGTAAPASGTVLPQLDATPGNGNPDTLNDPYLQLLTRHPNPPCLQTSAGRQASRHRRWHRRARRLLLGGGALLLVFALYRASTVEDDSAMLPTQPFVETSPSTLPDGIAAAELAPLAEAYRRLLRQREATPEAAWGHLATALDTCDAVELEHLAWQYDGTTENVVAEARIAASGDHVRPCFQRFSDTLTALPATTVRFEPSPFAGSRGSLAAGATPEPQPIAFKIHLERPAQPAAKR